MRHNVCSARSAAGRTGRNDRRSAEPEVSEYTVDVMIEIVRKNINRSAEMARCGELDKANTGSLITISQGLNILARQIEREWNYKNK